MLKELIPVVDLDKKHRQRLDDNEEKIRLYRCTILDCWELLQFKPKQKSSWLSTRLRNEELIENQEELINQLKEILEPVVDKIKENKNES